MISSSRPLARIASAVAALALTTTGLAVMTAAPALAEAQAPSAALQAAPERVYDSLPTVLPPSYPSVGFAARSTSEFGDFVQLGGTQRALSSVTVSLTDWACESDFTLSGTTWTPAQAGTACTTTPGATFAHPITVNVYDVDNRGAVPKLGALITSVTQTVAVPFRPSASPECTNPTQWMAENGVCANGLAFKVDFPLVDHPVVSGDVVVSVGYNTNVQGVAPMGQAGPYDSLNVSVRGANPSIGKDESIDEMFQKSALGQFYADGGSAGVGTLRADTDWTGSHGLVMEINADDSFIPTQTQTSTVRQAEIKPSETTATYQSWHEGQSAPAYSVKPDGLHLGTPTRSTIIKGTDVANSEVSESRLRALLASASVTVADGSVTFQLPVFFGSALTSGNYSFTTLRSTDLTAGTRTFELTDMWATTRAFGSYTAQQEAPLGELLNAIFSSNAKVWLGGYGVTANTEAVVPTLAFGDTTYTFTQPVTQACTAVTAGPVATSTTSGGWTFGESRTQGTNTFTASGLEIATFGNAPASGPDQRKAAGYLAVSIPLKDVGVPKLNLGATSGSLPSIQLRADFDNNGSYDATLVGESIYGNDYWVPDNAPQFVKDAAPSHGGGFGSSNHGTLDGWLASFPDAKLTAIGYSLGSGVVGSAVIQSIEVACQTYGFLKAPPAAATSNETVNDHGIRSNEAIYAGWHEGATNAKRGYSVKADGLHLGDNGVNSSQIINGLPVPLATADLEGFITASSVDVASGNVSLQFPIFYGDNASTTTVGDQFFTTLRIENLSAGVTGPVVSDVFVSSGAIRNASGTAVLPAGTKLPLADWSAYLTSLGGVKVLAYGVQVNAPAVVTSVTANGLKTTFSPLAAAAPAETVRVLGSEIKPTETPETYSSWHEGYLNATPAYAVVDAGLKLGIGNVKSQIIRGGAASNSPAVGPLIDNAGVSVVSGAVTYQVPIFFDTATTTNTFATLRSATLTAGPHTFDLTSPWVSSRNIGSTIVANVEYPLGDILDATTAVRWLGFGVQAGGESVVSDITWNGTMYTFAGGITGPVPVVTGTAAVGQTLTVATGTWSPAGVALSTQWKVDGVAVSGATSSTFTLRAADLGKPVTVSVTGTLDGLTTVVKTSAPLTVAAGTLTTTVPTIEGTAQVGQTLTATAAAWGPAPVSVTYEWLRNGSPIATATGATYVVSASDLGTVLSVKATGIKAGYATTSTTSSGTAAVTAAPATTVAVYRFYSPSTGAHFFTNSTSERDQVIANYPRSVWTYEGVAYNAYLDGTSAGSTPLYRFYSAKFQTHFFTTSSAERDGIIAAYPTNVWKYEGIAYYVGAATAATGVEVYRFFDAKKTQHFFTASATERDFIRSTYGNVFTYEGVAYKVPAVPAS